MLRQRHRLVGDAPDDFEIYNPADVLATQEGSARVFSILLASIASISLIVGGISIMNIMLVSVSERTREIGLRMALGARGRDIRRQFLIEATVLSLIGGALGIALGSVAAVVIASLRGWPVLISPWIVSCLRSFDRCRSDLRRVPGLARSAARSDGCAAVRMRRESGRRGEGADCSRARANTSLPPSRRPYGEKVPGAGEGPERA